MSTVSLADTISGAGGADEAVELLCTSRSAVYLSFLARLSSAEGASDADAVLRAVQSLRPTARLSGAFGATPAPVLLLLAPAALQRVAAHLSDPRAPLSESHCAHAVLRAARHCALTAARLSALPPPPPLRGARRHGPPWAPADDSADAPPRCGDGSAAGDFAAALHAVPCGLAHFLRYLRDGATAALAGAGTLELLRRALQLAAAPAVVGCGAKEHSVQSAIAAMLLAIRAALEQREAAGEAPQRQLLGQWEGTVRDWFDLATQSNNITCIQMLFPYMMSL